MVKKRLCRCTKKRRKNKDRKGKRKGKRAIKKAEQDKGEERKAQKRPVYGQQVTNAWLAGQLNNAFALCQ